MDLHLHGGLVYGDGTLGSLAGPVVSAALVGDADCLVLARAQLGEGADCLSQYLIDFALDGHPLGQNITVKKITKAGNVSNQALQVLQAQVHAALGVDELGLVLDGEVVRGQGLLFREGGVVPVDDIVKDGLLHDGGVHVVGEGYTRLQGHGAGDAVVGGGHIHGDGVAPVLLVSGPRDADLPLAGAELFQTSPVRTIQRLEFIGDVGGEAGVVLHGHILCGELDGRGGRHHSFVDGLGGGRIVIALVRGELHAHLVRAFVQVELNLLPVVDGDGGFDGGRGVGLIARPGDADFLFSGGNGRVLQGVYSSSL